MKYYLHDTNSFNDDKITELYMNFGYEGLGLFYSLLEKLAAQEKPIKTTVLKSQLKVGKKLEKCWKFMESIELIYSNNGDTFNEKLLNFSEKYQIKKEINAKRISEWRENQTIEKNVTRYEHICNAPKVNISKENINKECKSVKAFTPPALEEVVSYFKENGYAEDAAKRAFNYYDVAVWHDSKGTKVKNWKQKMQAVWFKEENLPNKSKNTHATNTILSNVDLQEQIKRF